MNLEKHILITHVDCHDGTSCAVFFLEHGGKQENIFFAGAGRVEECIVENNVLERPEHILITDLSLKEQNIIDRFEKRGEFTLIDHHDSALWLNNKEWATVDVSACGTELFRRYLKDERECAIKYAKLVDDIDRWQKKCLPYSEELVEFHDFIGQEEYLKEFKDFYCLDHRFRYDNFLDDQECELVEFIIKKRDKAIEKSLKNIKTLEVKIDGRILKFGYCLNKSSNVLLNKILYELNHDVAVGFNLATRNVSLRTKPEINVARIAELYGGGGNRTAAGHRLSKEFVDEFISNIHGALC